MFTGFKTFHPENMFVFCSNAELCRNLTVSIYQHNFKKQRVNIFLNMWKNYSIN